MRHQTRCCGGTKLMMWYSSLLQTVSTQTQSNHKQQQPQQQLDEYINNFFRHFGGER